MTAPDDALEQTLARYAGTMSAAMAVFLADGEPDRYLYDLVRDYPARTGKGFRVALLLAAVRAYGGRSRDGFAPALALELLHNAFLVHDDVEDDSPRRRGRPSLHRVHGVGLAVNAGDALSALALRPLRDDRTLGDRLSARLLTEFSSTVQITTEGQAMDLGWRRDALVDLGPADYIAMSVRKTGWYTAVLPIRAGAIVGSRGTATLNRLTRLGCFVGVAFQIQDDLLDLVGTAGPGKVPYQDLREGKRTLMMLHLVNVVSGADRSWLKEFLARDPLERTDADLERVRDLMKSCGCLELARDYRDALTAAAQAGFDEAFTEVPESTSKQFLRAAISYAGHRRW